MENTKPKFPTEMVELPSKGLLYPEGHPLASGQVEMKYMTAKEEDILTNQNYLKQGTVIDKLLQSLIVTKFNYDDLLVAARILGYGKNYNFTYRGKQQTVDLSLIDNKKIDESLFAKGKNEFSYTLPHSGNVIVYKILNGHDESQITSELEGLKKINPDASPELSTRLKYMILSVDGETERKSVRDFVDNYFLAIDSRAFRDHIRQTQPDVDLVHTLDNGEEVSIPIGIGFFWPDI